MSNYDINNIDSMNEVNYNRDRDTSKSNSYNINKEDSIASQNSKFINNKIVNINSIEEYDTSSNNKSISMLNKKRDKSVISGVSKISKITKSLKLQNEAIILSNKEKNEKTNTGVDKSNTEIKKANNKPKININKKYMVRNTDITSYDENYSKKYAGTRISFPLLSFSFSELNQYKSFLRKIKKKNHYVNDTFLNSIT